MEQETLNLLESEFRSHHMIKVVTRTLKCGDSIDIWTHPWIGAAIVRSFVDSEGRSVVRSSDFLLPKPKELFFKKIAKGDPVPSKDRGYGGCCLNCDEFGDLDSQDDNDSFPFCDYECECDYEIRMSGEEPESEDEDDE